MESPETAPPAPEEPVAGPLADGAIPATDLIRPGRIRGGNSRDGETPRAASPLIPPLVRRPAGADTPVVPNGPIATASNGSVGTGGANRSKRGATAAEALATELHREIGLREKAEARLAETEARLAALESRDSAAPPAASSPSTKATSSPATTVPTLPSVPGSVPIPPPPLPPALVPNPAKAAVRASAARPDPRVAELEAKLAQAEQRLGYLTTSSPLGFIDADAASGNAYFSFGFKALLGYGPDELPDTYQTLLDLLHPEDRPVAWQRRRGFGESVGTGVNRFSEQLRLRHKDGAYRWIESTGTEFVAPDGKRLRLMGFYRDITTEKELEKRLRDSEERIDLMLTGSPLGFFDADMVTGRAYLSAPWKTMLGYRPDELADLYQTFLDLLHPDDLPGALARMNQCSPGEGRRSFSVATRCRHKDGTYRWIQASGIHFFAPDGRLVRSMGFTTDINALKVAEEALAREKHALNVTLDSISDGIITTDVHGHTTYLNAAAEALCGLRTAEAAGLPVEEIYRRSGAQTRLRTGNPVRVVLSTGHRAAPLDPVQLQSPGRPERVITDCAGPITAPGGKMVGAVLVFHDITNRLTAAEEMQKAGRIESLGVLAGGIAHDFNNLLTAMLGNLSVARSGGDLPGRAVDALSRAEKACWRARDLTGQLLTFAKGGDPVCTTTDLVPLIDRAVRLASGGTNVQLHARFEPDLPTVEADGEQLTQVFHNLAINAVQAMPNGGSLDLVVSLVGAPEDLPALAEAADTPAKAYIEVRLRDTGTGIALENLSKIFDPFFSTRTNGTGLGLAIAYSIIRKHDGVIRVESTLGAGSTFTVYLPVLPQAIPPARERPAEPFSLAGGRVLFMDDDPDIRDLAGAILGLIGYDATLTAEGSETLAVYQQARAEGRPFAAVILDLTIPGGMGGKETIRRLRELDPDVRAIVSSGYSNDAVIADYRAHGFMAMVAKPYRMEDLSRVLTEAITGVSVG